MMIKIKRKGKMARGFDNFKTKMGATKGVWFKPKPGKQLKNEVKQENKQAKKDAKKVKDTVKGAAKGAKKGAKKGK